VRCRRSSCGSGRRRSARGVAELCEHPGAEDDADTGLAEVDPSVRVLAKMRLDLALQGLGPVHRVAGRDQRPHPRPTVGLDAHQHPRGVGALRQDRRDQLVNRLIPSTPSGSRAVRIARPCSAQSSPRNSTVVSALPTLGHQQPAGEPSARMDRCSRRHTSGHDTPSAVHLLTPTGARSDHRTRATRSRPRKCSPASGYQAPSLPVVGRNGSTPTRPDPDPDPDQPIVIADELQPISHRHDVAYGWGWRAHFSYTKPTGGSPRTTSTLSMRCSGRRSSRCARTWRAGQDLAERARVRQASVLRTVVGSGWRCHSRLSTGVRPPPPYCLRRHQGADPP